jgi:hypothetical protein
MDNIFKWLKENELEKYHQVLLENAFTNLELLTELSDDDLKELGFLMGDRKRFKIAVNNLCAGSGQLSEEESRLLDKLPYLIAYPLQDTFQQSDYEKKLHRLAYTFNNFLKYLGLISISEFMHSDFKSRKMIDLFESNIGEPSFGRWNQFIRESYALLFKEKVKLVFPEVYKFYQKSNEKKFKIEVELIDDFGDVNYSEKTGICRIG